MKHTPEKTLFVIAGIIVTAGIVILPQFAMAQTSENNTPNTRTESPRATQTNIEITDTEVAPRSAVREERKEVSRERLADLKLKVCQNREQQINTIFDRIITRSTSHLERITTIADKTKVFYVKQGNVLNTYDSLVASVDAAYIKAKQAMDTLAAQPKFSCDTDGPKSDIQNFRNQRVGKTESMGAYRQAVKDLIAAVKSVQPAEPVTSTENMQ